MFKKILVPLDGSPDSEKVLPWVTGLAKPLGASLEMLAVVEPDKLNLPHATPERPRHGADYAPYDRPGHESQSTRSGAAPGFGAVGGGIGRGSRPERPPAYGTQIVDQALEQARTYLSRLAAELREDHDLAVDTRATAGKPEEEILLAARSVGADMLALATRRESTLSRGILGSVTDRVLRTSEIPVLVVHPRIRAGFPPNGGSPKQVIIPLDGSELSQRAVEPGLSIAKAAGASVLFVRAIHYTYFPVSELAAGPYSHGDTIRELRILARDYLKPFLNQAETRGLDRASHVEVGVATSVIVEEAERHPGGLIVMSTHGRTGVQRFVLGSVADKVIRSSGAPVLVIPPPRDDA